MKYGNERASNYKILVSFIFTIIIKIRSYKDESTMEEIIEKLKEWVNKNYDPYACGFTPQRSEGNYYDCFFDGESCGTSYAAYEVGQILGLELTTPEDDGENNEY